VSLLGSLFRSISDRKPAPDHHGDGRAVLGGAAWLEVKRCRHGVLAYNRNDVFIGRSLSVYGEYSEDEVAFLCGLVGAGDTVVEAGANIGSVTVPLARAVGPGGRVIAFEPQRIAFELLCANAVLNELGQIEPCRAAVGAEPGDTIVPVVPPERTFNFGGVALGDAAKGDRVPVQRIDDLALGACRVVMADVEGMEAGVIEGARETIAKHRPILYVENNQKDRSPALIALVQSLDYRLFWHFPPLFNAANFAGVVENVLGPAVSANMLCIPRGSDAGVAAGLAEIAGPESFWRAAGS
jgi:FkbM family methyltransferase